MPADMTEMLDAANAVVPHITAKEAQLLIASGPVLIVDVREPHEIQTTGKVFGAIAVPRGMLESRADPNSPHYDRRFAKGETVVLYCASGVRSALAGKLLRDMGYENVFNLGGFKDWVSAGGKVDAG